MEDYTFQKDYIRDSLALGYQIIAGTLNLLKEDSDGYIEILVPLLDILKADYEMNIPLTELNIRRMSDITKLSKPIFDRMVYLFGIKLI